MPGLKLIEEKMSERDTYSDMCWRLFEACPSSINAPMLFRAAIKASERAGRKVWVHELTEGRTIHVTNNSNRGEGGSSEKVHTRQ